MLDPVPFPETAAPSHQAELFSMRMLHRGHLTMCDFQTLLELLAGKCATKKRKCASNDIGAGVRAFYCWTARLLVAVVRCNHRFNAVALHRNTFMAMHTDSHNAKGYPNLVLSCSLAGRRTLAGRG